MQGIAKIGGLMAALAVGLLGTGCGPSWKVLKASGPPSAIKGVKSFAVASDYAGLRVGKKSEAEYLAEKDEEAKKNWEGDKTAMHEEFVKALASELKDYSIVSASGAESGPDVVVITVHYVHIEPGFYAAVARHDSSAVARISFGRGGDTVDEIEMTATASADLYHPSSGQRLRNCAEDLGERTADFIAAINKP